MELENGGLESAEVVARRDARVADERTPSLAARDPLAEATAIARSAALEDIDWTREPLTQREAAVRKRWLENQLANPFRRLSLKMMAIGHSLNRRTTASDLAAAVAEAKRIEAEDAQRRERQEIYDIAAELDDEAGR